MEFNKISHQIRAFLSETTPDENTMLPVLTEQIAALGCIHNESFQFFPLDSQKQKVYKTALLFYETHNLCNPDKLAILQLLTSLAVDKEKLCAFLLTELAQCGEENALAWSICDNLFHLKCRAFQEAYIAAASRKELGKARQMLFLLFGSLRDPAYLPVLLDNLDDKSVNGHVLSALSRYKNPELDMYFPPFLDDPRAWVRKIAEKRVGKK